MAQSSYYASRDRKNNAKIAEILKNTLPEYCDEFFLGIEQRTSSLTRLGYAYDLSVFFKYLTENVAKFSAKNTKQISLEDIEQLSPFEVEKYLSWLSSYQTDDNDGKVTSNGANGKARKLSALRSMIKYFIKKQVIKIDPTFSIDTPKIKEKEIIRLEDDEVSEMLDVVDSGKGLSDHQLAYQENTKMRDTAIVALLLGTGIRVSELVGIDMSDFDFDNRSFVITRKGGARVILYFSDEVAGMVFDYFRLRKNNTTAQTQALFLSLQNKRITTRAVENIIKKYSSIATPLKKITPHKLRSTFGTRLYKNTGDIYVVADVLGHKDVNTTKKHYAAITDDIRRKASLEVKLIDDKKDEDK